MRRHRVAVACLAVAAACGGDAEAPLPGDLIDRETFIETYVDLRVAAVRSPDFRLTSEQRDAILRQHGVDAESLVAFADAHGRDLDFMNEVWAEIETRLEARAAGS